MTLRFCHVRYTENSITQDNHRWIMCLVNFAVVTELYIALYFGRVAHVIVNQVRDPSFGPLYVGDVMHVT